MPLPKGIKTPEVRAAWLSQHREQLREFDRLVAGGATRAGAARTIGRDVTSVDAMRHSVEGLEEHGSFVGRAGQSYIDLGLSLLACLLKPGEALTAHDIAAWCGCSGRAIQRIEALALRKVRQRLLVMAGDEEAAEELRERLSRGQVPG